MPTISLTTPTALTVITAGLHATNYASIQSLLNGGLDNANIAPSANIALSKVAFPGGTTFPIRGDGTAGPTTTIGTSLPGSPVDGQEAILVDSLTAPTYAWRFRYVSGISDSYKWVLVGGSPIRADIHANGTQETIADTATYFNAPTPGPSIVVPNAGIYEVGTGFRVALNVSGGGAWMMSYDIGGTGAVDADGVMSGGGSNVYPSAARFNRKTFTAASTTLACKFRNPYNVNGWSAQITTRWISLLPVRVA